MGSPNLVMMFCHINFFTLLDVIKVRGWFRLNPLCEVVDCSYQKKKFPPTACLNGPI